MADPIDTDRISDGFGTEWERCGPGCDLHVVRPGKVQCNCTADQCPNVHDAFDSMDAER